MLYFDNFTLLANNITWHKKDIPLPIQILNSFNEKRRVNQHLYKIFVRNLA